MTSSSNIQIIKKNQIKLLNFPEEDVLDFKKDQISRFYELKETFSLGSLKNEKFKIFFVDDKGLKKIETTVSGITNQAVIIKKSIIIPIKRVISMV